MRAEDAVWVNRKFFFFLAFLFILLLIGSGTFGYLYFARLSTSSSNGLEGLTSQNAILGASEMSEDQILSAVRKLILLPDEKPTFAKVSDVQKLKGNELFKNAKSGDIVMIFEKAQKVVIFRPETGQIIEVAKISSNNQTESLVVPTAVPTETLTPTPTNVPVVNQQVPVRQTTGTTPTPEVSATVSPTPNL